MEDKKIRKLGKIGGEKNYSYYVTIPIEYVRAMGWRDGQKLQIKKVGKRQRIIIENRD